MKIEHLIFAAFLLTPGQISGQIDVTRSLFTPPVVSETQTDPVRFEATVIGNPPSVVFEYDGADRPMFNDGTNGDQVAGDDTWTIMFTPSEILSKNTPSRIFRPFIGFVRVEGFGRLNVFGEVWTSAIGLREVRSINGGGQETDYIANYNATRSELMTFDPRPWAQRFYQTHGDDFDFLNFVLIPGRRGNRFHSNVKNTVQGIGLSIFDNSAAFGSAGMLKGINQYPLSGFFDGGEKAFSHETGHQWINFLTNTPYGSGRPHWPRGNIAGNVMGFSQQPSNQGGDFPFTFTPSGSGGYVVGPSDHIIRSTFNSMELYLVGLIPPDEVNGFFILTNQTQTITVGQTLLASEVTPVSIDSVIASYGPRTPDHTQSQKNFRVATIVISEQLLDDRAMAFYDYFARRTEARGQLPFASGFATGICNPWYLATGGRSEMRSALNDNSLTITVTNTNDSGAGSLRQAIADAAPGGTINFDPSVFSSPQTVTLASGQLLIDKNLTIQGPGASLLSISGTSNEAGVFRINSGVSATLDGVTIRDAFVYNSSGGGIFNGGTLIVSNSTISGNSVYDCSDAGCSSVGGGIFNIGTLTVINSTISGNTADFGGGIYNSGTLTVSNSTISGNDDSYGAGGGIANSNYYQADSTVTITNSTISGNRGGIHSIVGGTETLINTIVANNTAGGASPDIFGIIETASHNLIGDAGSSGGIMNGVNGNIVGVNPLLGPLQNNGGPTLTHALLTGSRAINAGNDCVLTENDCGDGVPPLPTDQRGFGRFGTVDIGAFERDPSIDNVALFDYDGDGRSDLSVRRPSDNIWYLLRGTAGYTAMEYGVPGDSMVPADYDGDGKTDVAMFRPSNGTWYIHMSQSQTFQTFVWGEVGDLPVPSDRDADGRTDLVVYRESNNIWYTRFANGTFAQTHFGVAGDKPVVGDFDGDGIGDIAVYRPSNNNWYIIKSSIGFFIQTWGEAGDIPITGDFDGDGATDQAVFRPSTGQWWLSQTTAGFASRTWGVAGDIPVAADYDGDGKTDVAVFRPSTGEWYIVNSTAGILVQHFGQDGDIPTQSAFNY